MASWTSSSKKKGKRRRGAPMLLAYASLLAIILHPLLFWRSLHRNGGILNTAEKDEDFYNKNNNVQVAVAAPAAADIATTKKKKATTNDSKKHKHHNNDKNNNKQTSYLVEKKKAAKKQHEEEKKKNKNNHPYDFYHVSSTANSNSNNNSNNKLLSLRLLSVPFYVYPELLMIDDDTSDQQQGDIHSNDSNSNSNSNSKNAVVTIFIVDSENQQSSNKPSNSMPLRYLDMDYWRHHMDEGQPMKHSDDYYFARVALQHPMRVFDPRQARIFVVPLLINAIAEHVSSSNTRAYNGGQSKLLFCWKEMCDYEEILGYADDILFNSTWYERSHGRDHLIVGGHWYVQKLLTRHYSKSNKKKKHKKRGDNIMPLRDMNHIRFENRDFSAVHHIRQQQQQQHPDKDEEDDKDDHNRYYYSVASTYVGKGCSASGSGKTHDFAFIANTPQHKFQFRREFCSFLKNRQPQFSVIGCGPMHECPALARAKYGFHMKGDTYGSNRLMNTLLSDTVPILMYPEQQYDILPPFIDWRSMSYSIDYETLRHNVTALTAALQEIVQDKVGYERKIKQIRLNRDLFDYTTNVPFEMYMFGLQCHLYPSTCNQTTQQLQQYPALRFDEILNKK